MSGIFGNINIKNMAEIGTYYKRGSNSDYIGVEVLGSAGVLPRVIIEEIKFHETLKVQGKTERERWTCKFVGIEKPMLLNSTCRKRLAKRFWNTIVSDGQPCAGRIDLLSGMGLAVRLDSEPCRDPSDGDMTIGLRISKLDPEPEPQKKVITEDKAVAVINWAKSNGTSFQEIDRHYAFATDDVRKQIKEALKG